MCGWEVQGIGHHAHMAYAVDITFCSGSLLVPVDNRLMKPHAYARALHLVDWRHRLFELRPVPLLTLFFWYAASDFGGFVTAGKRNSFWFLHRPLVKFECAAY